MKMTKTNYLILLLLALIFALPGLSAYLFYCHPQSLLVNKTNKGELLNPPLLFSELAQGKPKWRLIYWQPNSCDKACLNEVDRLARIRLALGRHLYEVDEWLVGTSSSLNVQAQIKKDLEDKDIHYLSLTDDALTKIPLLATKPKIFIGNPKGYLVLAYEEKANSQDIYHDIKHLLSKSG